MSTRSRATARTVSGCSGHRGLTQLCVLTLFCVVSLSGCTEIPRQTHTTEHVEVSRDADPVDPGKVAWTPESVQLSDAVVRGDLEKVESLIAASPELVHSRVFGGTVLTGAISGALVRTRSSESIRAMVRLLLESGAEVDTKNAGGLAPLHYAARVGLKGVVEELLGKDADTNIRDSYGSTPLRDAALSGHRDVVEALLLKKADPNARDNIGMTPLHAAAQGVGLRTIIEGVDVRKEMLDALQNQLNGFGVGGAPGQFFELIEKALKRLGVARNAEEFFERLVEAMSGTGHKEVARLLLEHGAGGGHRHLLDRREPCR